MGCESADPAGEFIVRMDAQPTEKQPPNWDNVKWMMSRRAPEVGSAAPDFTLPAHAGDETITRSQFQSGKPLVLIFGSFT